MDGNKNVKNRVEAFFGGKGFYIVLFVCLAVIGVSAWAMLFSGNGEEDAGLGSLGEASVSVMAGQDDNSVSDVDVVIKQGDTQAVKPQLSTEHENADKEESQKTETVVPEEENSTATAEDSGEVEEQTSSNKKLTFMWPVSGSVAVEYSPDALLYSKTMADWRIHNGIDVSAQMGTKVFAAADGKVDKVYADDLYGTTVVIDHGNGLVSVYSNLAATPTVKEGDAVTMGSVIGAVGDTALGETGEVAHLHFAMMLEEAYADPADYLPKR